MKKSLVILACLFFFYNCQKEETENFIIQNKFSVPAVESAKSNFTNNSRISFNSNSTRTSDSNIEVDWDNSTEELFKTDVESVEGEQEEDINILQTPIINISNVYSKTFIGSIEIQGIIQSKIISLLYLDSTDYSTFSGYMLIYNLDGNLEFADKYINGQRVDPTSLSTSTNVLRTNDCNFDEIGCLLDWLNGDLNALAVFIANHTLDQAVVNAYLPNGTTINDGPFGFGGSIPIVEAPDPVPTSGGGGGNYSYWSVPYWYNYNKIAPDATSIGIALDLHPLSSVADWLLNQANEELLAAIAEFLNANRENNETLSDDTGNEINNNPNPNIDPYNRISQEAIDYTLEIIYTGADNTLITALPFFKYPEGTNYTNLYPNLTVLLKEYIPRFKNDNRLLTTIHNLTGLSTEIIKNHLTWGKGPEVHIEQLGLDSEGYQYKGKFNTSKPNIIVLDIDMVNLLEALSSIENPTEAEAEQLAFMNGLVTFAMALHEYVHFADFAFDGTMSDTETLELGLLFEELFNGGYYEFLPDGTIRIIKSN